MHCDGYAIFPRCKVNEPIQFLWLLTFSFVTIFPSVFECDLSVLALKMLQRWPSMVGNQASKGKWSHVGVGVLDKRNKITLYERVDMLVLREFHGKR